MHISQSLTELTQIQNVQNMLKIRKINTHQMCQLGSYNIKNKYINKQTSDFAFTKFLWHLNKSNISSHASTVSSFTSKF